MKAELAKKVRGQVAIASAKVAYQIYKDIFGSARYKTLATQGARVQRLLWASTGTKNLDYSDVKSRTSLTKSSMSMKSKASEDIAVDEREREPKPPTPLKSDSKKNFTSNVLCRVTAVVATVF